MTCIFPPECAVMRVHTQACPRWTSTLCPTSWLTWTYPGKLWPGLGIVMTFPLSDFILTSISVHSCTVVEWRLKIIIIIEGLGIWTVLFWSCCWWCCGLPQCFGSQQEPSGIPAGLGLWQQEDWAAGCLPQPPVRAARQVSRWTSSNMHTGARHTPSPPPIKVLFHHVHPLAVHSDHNKVEEIESLAAL